MLPPYLLKMTFNLYLLHNYNNYFNRIVKKETTLEDYINAVDDYFVCENVNFAIGDGVNTSHIINKTDTLEYDYCVVTDSEDNILSRWFIKENIKTRNSQWNITLKRDVIVDFYEKTINAPLYLEKGFVSEDSPLILKKENIEFNQIKKQETILKDKTQTAWLVGYYQNLQNLPKTIRINGYEGEFFTPQDIANAVGITTQQVEDILENNLRVYELNNGVKPYKIGVNTSLYNNIQLPVTFKSNRTGTEVEVDNSFVDSDQENIMTSWYCDAWMENNYNQTQLQDLATSMAAALNNQGDRETALRNICVSDIILLSSSQMNSLRSFSGKIYSSDGGTTLKKINYNVEGNILKKFKQSNNNTLNNVINDIGTWFNQYGRTTMKLIINASSKVAWVGVETIQYNFNTQQYTYTIESQFDFTSYFMALNDRPYKMFMIPLTDFKFKINDTTYTSTLSGLPIAREIAKAFNVSASSGVFDIQLLPYFIYQDKIDENNVFQTSDLVEGLDYQLIKKSSNNEVVSIIIFPQYDSTSFTLDYQIESEESKKVVSNCDMWRICSPNYQGAFDFNIADNGGSVEYFNAFITYKPYTPFIKVAPQFNYLYGTEFADQRGCICGGDYSITILNDAWTTYELNNKNYQNIFNRDIQHLEFAQGQEKVQQIFSMIGGVGQGIAGGAITGSKFGVGGAIGGAALGGVAGLTGGIVDYQLMGERHKESLDYAQDKFELHIGNIKAIPDTLTKVSNFDIISKIYPFLEYYTCTDEEKQYFKDKIKYDGMSLGVISKLSNFISEEKHYFKGRLIRIEELGEDNHIACDIYNELLKGVYL